MWIYAVVPNKYTYIPQGLLHMLIIEQPDKMLTDLRNSKGSRELSATSMEILVSGNNFNVLNTVFSLFHCSHNSHLLQTTVTCRLVIPLFNAAFRQSVPSQNLFSITFDFVESF
jgi:hypothetical protein